MDAVDDEDVPDSDSGDQAAAAFEALRAEVAGLRRAVEAAAAFAAAGGDREPRAPAPDYTLTLGAMAQALAKIEAHPALKLTPEVYGRQVSAGVEAAAASADQALRRATGEVEFSARRLEAVAGHARHREAQDRRLWQLGVGGLILGAVAWAALSGPFARALPGGLAVPEQMAAATLGMDRWRAGERMMESANPSEWRRLTGDTQLLLANEAAVTACRKAAADTGREQRCVIRVARSRLPGNERGS